MQRELGIEWPLVSVIIPVRNGGARLGEVLRACANQSYQGKWETIIVDNGSTDAADVTAAGNPGVQVLRECEHDRSPYSARNRGIEVARGRIIALLDATCVPRPEWLAEGVMAMQRVGRGLVAGEVAFRFTKVPPTAGEVWDSVANVRQDLAVQRGVAKTGNLFIHADLLASQGLFREGARCAEDVRWTGMATSAGWPLVYADRAVVEINARGGLALLRKLARTGSGKAELMSGPHRVAKGVALLIVPPSPGWVGRLMRERGELTSARSVLRVWLFAWCGRVAHGLGHLFPSLLIRAC